jgi:predicted amidohydrolase YtcJ
MRVLLQGGRVCDPGTGVDAVADVLIENGTVSAVNPGLTPQEAQVIDVSGLVVGPGFIDLRSHVHSVAGQRLQAFDGETTTLDLEAGLMPIGRAYDEAAKVGWPAATLQLYASNRRSEVIDAHLLEEHELQSAGSIAIHAFHIATVATP